MTEMKTCKKCGSEFPANVLAGICPRCLLQAGLLESSPAMVSAGTVDTILTDSTAPSDPANDLPMVLERTSTKDIPVPGKKIRYFGEYELLEEIARGGMGVVFRARQVRLNRIVALKMILAGQFAGPADVQRFHTEAEAAAQLDHAGIVPVFEVGQYDGHHYFSMGLVEGESLAKRIADGPLPPRIAADLVLHVTEAIQYAHSRGVIHRDLKPANVLLDKTGQPKVTDFGLAKRIQGDSHLTASGQILGTPSYMPPEQAAGRVDQVRETADIYSLGAILYATLTGRPPFQADNPLDTIMQVIEREPVSPRMLNPAVPLDLETICLKCLEKDRRKRYGSADELAQELRRYLDDKPILARPVGRVERAWRWCRRNSIVAGLLAAVAVSLVVGTWVSTWFAINAEAHANAEAEQRRTAETNAASLHLERSLSRCNPDDPGAGLLWLTRSLAEAQRIRNAGLEDLCRLQLAAWSRDVCPLHAILPTGPVRSVSFSHEGQTILTSLDGSLLQQWDAATGEEDGKPVDLAADASPAHVVFDSTGRRVAVSRLDHSVQCYSTDSGKPIGPELRLSARMAKTTRFVVFSPDGERLLSISENGSVRLWQITSGESVEILAPNTDRMASTAAFSPDGNELLLALRDAVLSCDGRTGEVAGPIDVLGTWLRGMTFSPDGQQLLTTTATEARLWDTKTWRQTGLPWTISASITDQVIVAFSHDGRLAATGDRDAVRLIDATSGLPAATPMRLRFQSSLDGETITSLSFSPDDSLLMAGGASTATCVWRIANVRDATHLLSHPGVIRGQFSPDGRVLVTGSQQNGAQMWDVESGQPHGPRLEMRGQVWALAFDHSGRRVLAGGNSQMTRVWNVENGEPLTPLLRQTNFVMDVAFAKDGQTFWATSKDGRVHHWDVATAQRLSDPLIPGENGSLLVGTNDTVILCQPSRLLDLKKALPIGSTMETGGWAMLHPDGRTLWTGKSALFRVDVKTGNVIGDPVTIPGQVGAMGRDGDHVVVVSEEDSTAVWFDLRQKRATSPQIDLHGLWKGKSATMGVAPLLKPTAMVKGPSQLSPDDRSLVVGTNRDIGGAVQFFDLASGQQIGMPWRHSAHIQRVGFSPEGRFVLAVLDNGTAILQRVMQPMPGSLDEVVLRVEALTGLTLADGDVVRPLNSSQWTERHKSSGRISQ